MIKVKVDKTGWVMKEHGYPESKLTVLYQGEDIVSKSGRHSVAWVCECSCEEHNIVTVSDGNLTKKEGYTKSCGCIVKARLSRDLKKYNTYDLSGEYGVGWTSNTNKEFYFDIEDYNLIKEYCWFETNKGYIQTNTKSGNKVDGRGHIKLHRLITNNQWKCVDHINRNKADNRKENLRECNRSQNGMNRDLYANNKTGITGVYYHKNTGKYEADIKINCKHTHLGLFTNKEDAIRARLEAEAKYYGEFAPQCHLFAQYGITQQNNKENENNEI